MKVQSVTKQETAYSKQIFITYDGDSYEVLLYWSNSDGYDLDFVGTDEPQWAIDWDDNNDESLEYTLDSLTDEIIEESYL